MDQIRDIGVPELVRRDREVHRIGNIRIALRMAAQSRLNGVSDGHPVDIAVVDTLFGASRRYAAPHGVELRLSQRAAVLVCDYEVGNRVFFDLSQTRSQNLGDRPVRRSAPRGDFGASVGLRHFG